MSEIKVSEMIEAESVNDEDLIMIVQNGVNKKVPASKVGTGKGGVTGDTLPIGAVIDYDGESAPSNWEEVEDTEKVILYENANGDNGSNFNLNDTIANYKEAKIDYVVAMGDYIINESKRIPIRDGAYVSLTCFMAHSDILQLLDIGRYLFSGTTFTKVHETRSRIAGDNTVTWDGVSTGIYITKITGYKEA